MAPDVFEPPPGEIELFWNVIQVARWLGVPPWVLVKQPAIWFNAAMAFADIEKALQEEQRKRKE